MIIRESWLCGLLILRKGSELCLKVGFPPLFRAEQPENRLPSALPGIQGEGEIQGFSIEGVPPLSWPEIEVIPQIAW